MMRPILLCLALCLHAGLLQAQDNRDAQESALPVLIEIVNQTEDPQLQLDVLKGVSDALKGRRSVPMPPGWEQLEKNLSNSPNAGVRALVQSLSLTFGSARARSALRLTLRDPGADAALRRNALEALLGARDPELPPLLLNLLSDSALRAPALRGLAGYDDPHIAPAILAIYPSLSTPEKRDALNSLASRAAFAKPLLAAVGNHSVPARDLTADVIRQLRNLKDPDVDQAIRAVWGVVQEISPDKSNEIEKYRRIYRAGGSQPGDALRGRAVFAKVCQQCHTLFDSGGKVGPDLTGSNRSDLDYILQNMVDPNAVIPNDYRSSTIETTDDRVLTGIIKRDDASALTVATANETITLPRNEIKSSHLSQLSMMPEGLLDALPPQEVRDLIYYLTRPAQVPLPATPDTLALFFNGQDLSNWSGNTNLWQIENGELVGRNTTALPHNEFIHSQMVFRDFRLTCLVKLTPNTGNSGIQFRSEPLPDGEVKGYQADAGAGWWGKIYEERGRGLLWDKPGDPFIKPGDWNLYEIVAVSSKILTALNGHPCAQLDDPQGAKEGVFAFQLHSGPAQEVRFKDFKFELDPKPELTTVK